MGKPQTARYTAAATFKSFNPSIRMPVYETSIIVDCPQERAFEFLLRPQNIVRISPPDLGLAITQAPEILDLGSQFEFKVQAYGHVLTMIHKIAYFFNDTATTET